MRLIQSQSSSEINTRDQVLSTPGGLIHVKVLGAACTIQLLEAHSQHMDDRNPLEHVPPWRVALSSLMHLTATAPVLPDPRTH
jgi:hypothetical protein